MAKRTRRSQRPSAPSRSPKPRSLALLAQRFSDAQTDFQKVEAEYNKAKESLSPWNSALPVVGGRFAASRARRVRGPWVR
jgi:hypothetical protein